MQFTAVPWLRDHMIERARSPASEMAPDPEQLQDTLARISRQLPEALRAAAAASPRSSRPPSSEKAGADDGRDVPPRGPRRRRHGRGRPAGHPVGRRDPGEVRRAAQGVGAFDRLLRRLLGLEAKMRQYRDGAVFVRTVIDEVGMDGFNQVWSSGGPSPAEGDRGALGVGGARPPVRT